MRYTRFSLMAITILAITALAACGGGSDAPGGSGSTAPPSQVPPSTVSGSQASSTITSSTPSQASSSTEASTGASSSTPGSTATDVATSGSGSSSGPTVTAPDPTAPPEPTAVPARVVAPGLVDSRPCLDEFGDMLANYEGTERFDADLINALSDEFVGLRPDCLAQGWDPEFTQKPFICNQWEDLPGALREGIKGREYRTINSTIWEITDLSGRTQIRINAHFSRPPLTSDIPAVMQAQLGDTVGGCWTYNGFRGLDGQSWGGWSRSYFKYKLQGELVLTTVVFSSGGKSNVVGVYTPNSYPGCDTLLQSALSEELDTGRPVGLAGVDQLTDQVRVTAGAACAAELGSSSLWQPSPVEGPSAACPLGSSTGLEDDGYFVLNWSEDQYDLYGSSACWVRSRGGRVGGVPQL